MPSLLMLLGIILSSWGVTVIIILYIIVRIFKIKLTYILTSFIIIIIILKDYNDVWKSNDLGVTWSFCTYVASWSARKDHGGVVIDSVIYLLGGSGAGSSGMCKFFL